MSVWSVELCSGWERIGQLQDDAYTFDGVQRDRETGEWRCAFPESAPSWTSRKVPDLPNFLNLTGASGSASTTIDKAALDITGDIDVRWFGSLNNWSGGNQTLINKWDDVTSDLRSWILNVESGGARVYISTDGTNFFFSSMFTVPFGNGQYGGVRFTRVASTGVTTVYFSEDGQTWTSAGTSTLSAGSNIFASSAAVVVGGRSNGTVEPPTGRALWAEVRNGINGTVVARPDFAGQIPGFRFEFSDGFGNQWSLQGFFTTAYIVQDPDAVLTPFTPRDVDTVRLVEDNRIRFAGFVGEPSQGTGGAERTLDADGIRWVLSGPDLWDVFRRRVAFPTPATANPSSWASSHDINTAVASTALASYLSDNMGVTALADRQIAGFSVVDGLVGKSGTWSARLQPTDELVRRICDDAEITVRLTVDFDGNLIASVESPRDLSELHVLSDQADLVWVRSRLIPARSTWVVAGGDGIGTGRTFRTSDSGASGLARRERFVDVSSLSEDSEVQATATANQRLDAESWVVSGEVADSVTETIGFGRGDGPRVGDKVTIQTATQRFVVRVASLAWHVTPDRQVVRPTLGEATPDALKGLLRDVADLSSRFGNNIA